MAATAGSKVSFAVIDDALIAECLKKEKDLEFEEKKKRHDEYPIVDFQEPILMTAAKELVISFRSISKIDNLETLDNLQVLRLDNNAIEKIEGISHLLNLRWLDLSFNNIAKIEGLDTLTKLTDLTLFNNNIEKLENLDKLTSLQVLSVGNNKLDLLDNLMYLRKFKTLEVANFDGNPVCRETDYKTMMYAFLPWLKYLDYHLIDESKRVEAIETHQHLLLDLEEQERNDHLSSVKDEEDRKQDEMLERCGLKQVYLLVDRIWADDDDGVKLQKLPGVERLVATYKEQVQQLVEQALEEGKRTAGVLEKELTEAQHGLKYIRAAADKRSKALVGEFETRKKHLLRDARAGDDPAEVLRIVGLLRRKSAELKVGMMTIEVELHEQCHDLANQFEINYIGLTSQRKDMFGAFFRELEECENQYKDAVTQKVLMMLEQAKEGKALDDLDEDTALLLGDKDVVMGAVQASNDAHIGALLACEDDVRTNEKARQTRDIQGEHGTEIRRNRARVEEIQYLADHIERQLADIEAEYTDDGGDEDDDY